jgi:hypothetical protein
MHKELKKKSERAERASELNRRASDPGERVFQASERSRRASYSGERAIPASERFRRASYDFYASERARAGFPEFLRERASASWAS